MSKNKRYDSKYYNDMRTEIWKQIRYNLLNREFKTWYSFKSWLIRLKNLWNNYDYYTEKYVEKSVC